ncbi:hypothetical protein CsatB_030175 [Cannabis sativa]
MNAAQDVKGKTLCGQDAFVLWDTFDFPLDPTQVHGVGHCFVVNILRIRSLLLYPTVYGGRKRLTNVEGFNNAIDKAIERSRNSQNKQVVL